MVHTVGGATEVESAMIFAVFVLSLMRSHTHHEHDPNAKHAHMHAHMQTHTHTHNTEETDCSLPRHQ